ncbi:MAG: hypothetical protein AAF921_12645 [Cyanobacteria bacterium P01_D01_bin.44]
MNSQLLHMLWVAVSETPSHLLARFDDKALSTHLINSIENRVPLSREEQNAMGNYIASRTPLIRELAFQ